jgi:hypothetical protein
MTVRILSLLTHGAANMPGMVVFEIKTYFLVMVGCEQLKTILSYLAELLVLGK